MAKTQSLEHKNRTKVALIGGGAIVLAAIVGLFRDQIKLFNSPEKYFYTGIVHDKSDGKAVKDAEVFIAEDQTTAEKIHTDSNGTFQTRLSTKTELIYLWVVKDGFHTYTSNVKPNRTGPEVIDLEPLKPVSTPQATQARSAPKLPADGHTASAPATLTVYAAPNIPPVSPESLTNETLRALTNDIANKLMEQYVRQTQIDGDYKDAKSMVYSTHGTEEAKAYIERTHEERRTKFAKDNVGLISDGNFLLGAIRPRIGPMPDEWRSFRFTIENLDPAILKEMAKRLGP